jgi:hypothetical protein
MERTYSPEQQVYMAARLLQKQWQQLTEEFDSNPELFSFLSAEEVDKKSRDIDAVLRSTKVVLMESAYQQRA